MIFSKDRRPAETRPNPFSLIEGTTPPTPELPPEVRELDVIVDAAKVGTLLKYVFHPNNAKIYRVHAEGNVLTISKYYRDETGASKLARWRILIGAFEHAVLSRI